MRMRTTGTDSKPNCRVYMEVTCFFEVHIFSMVNLDRETRTKEGVELIIET